MEHRCSPASLPALESCSCHSVFDLLVEQKLIPNLRSAYLQVNFWGIGGFTAAPILNRTATNIFWCLLLDLGTARHHVWLRLYTLKACWQHRRSADRSSRARKAACCATTLNHRRNVALLDDETLRPCMRASIACDCSTAIFQATRHDCSTCDRRWSAAIRSCRRSRCFCASACSSWLLHVISN